MQDARYEVQDQAEGRTTEGFKVKTRKLKMQHDTVQAHAGKCNN